MNSYYTPYSRVSYRRSGSSSTTSNYYAWEWSNTQSSTGVSYGPKIDPASKHDNGWWRRNKSIMCNLFCKINVRLTQSTFLLSPSLPLSFSSSSYFFLSASRRTINVSHTQGFLNGRSNNPETPVGEPIPRCAGIVEQFLGDVKPHFRKYE